MVTGMSRYAYNKVQAIIPDIVATLAKAEGIDLNVEMNVDYYTKWGSIWNHDRDIISDTEMLRQIEKAKRMRCEVTFTQTKDDDIVTVKRTLSNGEWIIATYTPYQEGRE